MEQLPLSGTLRNLFAELDIRCVLDVGANKGQYRDFLRSQVDYQGLIISFEPIQKNAVILQDRAKRDNRWFTYPYALGSTNTNRTLATEEARTTIDRLSERISKLDPQPNAGEETEG